MSIAGIFPYRFILNYMLLAPPEMFMLIHFLNTEPFYYLFVYFYLHRFYDSQKKKKKLKKSQKPWEKGYHMKI